MLFSLIRKMGLCSCLILVVLMFFFGAVFVTESDRREQNDGQRLPVVINTWPFTNATQKGKALYIWYLVNYVIDLQRRYVNFVSNCFYRMKICRNISSCSL